MVNSRTRIPTASNANPQPRKRETIKLCAFMSLLNIYANEYISPLSLLLPMPKPHKIILFQEGLRDSHLHGFLFASSTPDYVPKEKRINISWNRGTMNVRNLSIPIYCDGFYLVSLKGTIKAMSQRNASLSLKVHKRSNEPILHVKVTEEVVDSVTVSEMQFKDKVYLEANRDANYKDLKLGLFLLTPRLDCLLDEDKM
uniref:TNF family profile domain-containing protein n=2 Tax=Chelydra serpentina TaxID=8475 RepID=A0A8C3SLY6_CHESE